MNPPAGAARRRIVATPDGGRLPRLRWGEPFQAFYLRELGYIDRVFVLAQPIRSVRGRPFVTQSHKVRQTLAFVLIYVYIKSMMNKLTGRGGAGRGQGRKPSEKTVETVPVAIRMSIEQREKLQRLGGAPWVRDRIERAKLPDK